MSVAISNCINKLVESSRDKRADAYRCLLDAITSCSVVTDCNTPSWFPVVSVLMEDLSCGNEKLILCALNLCACLISSHLSSWDEGIIPVPIIDSNMYRNIGECVLRLLHSRNYDIILMCMFVLAQQTQSAGFGGACNSQCAVQVMHLMASDELLSHLCEGKSARGRVSTDNYAVEIATKLKYWSYKALTCLAELRAIRYDLFDYAEIAHVYSASFTSILKVLNEKSEQFTSPLSSTATNSNEEGILLPLVQLEFLLKVPKGKGLVLNLQQVLSTNSLIGETIRYDIFLDNRFILF